MTAVSSCLWFDGQAEEAAQLYTSLVEGSTIDKVMRSPADNPSGPEGSVLMVDFTLGGQRYSALNGGPHFHFTEAVSVVLSGDSQEEADRCWHALIADGGSAGQCGWLKDRFGMSWQIVPQRVQELLSDPDPDVARRAMQAMLSMQRLDAAEMERAAYAPA